VNKQFGVKKLLRVVFGDLLCTGHMTLRMRSDFQITQVWSNIQLS